MLTNLAKGHLCLRVSKRKHQFALNSKEGNAGLPAPKTPAQFVLTEKIFNKNMDLYEPLLNQISKICSCFFLQFVNLESLNNANLFTHKL